MLQQEQRSESHDLALAGKQLQQQTRQADGLFAQRLAQRHFTAGCGIAFVEQQVQHRGHGGDSLCTLRRARRFERHIGRAHATLGTRDALLHGRFGDQERAGNFLDRQAADHPQRQRNLLRRRQLGMTANEQQTQHVIAIPRIVETLRKRRFGIVGIGNDIVGRQVRHAALLARLIDAHIARHQDQPCSRIIGRSVHGPALEGAQTRLLEGLFGHIQVAEITQQCADRLRTGFRNGCVDPAEVCHLEMVEGQKL